MLARHWLGRVFFETNFVRDERRLACLLLGQREVAKVDHGLGHMLGEAQGVLSDMDSSEARQIVQQQHAEPFASKRPCL